MMDLDSLTPFPEWDDEKHDDEDGDAWKTGPQRAAAKQLYNQWLLVYLLLQGICDSVKPANDKPAAGGDKISGDSFTFLKDMILQDGLMVPVKIIGAAATSIYILHMENAAIIRKTAMDVLAQCETFRMLSMATDDEVDAVVNEISIFRQYFTQWVAGFVKDEFADEWGLF